MTELSSTTFSKEKIVFSTDVNIFLASSGTLKTFDKLFLSANMIYSYWYCKKKFNVCLLKRLLEFTHEYLGNRRNLLLHIII